MNIRPAIFNGNIIEVLTEVKQYGDFNFSISDIHLGSGEQIFISLYPYDTIKSQQYEIQVVYFGKIKAIGTLTFLKPQNELNLSSSYMKYLENFNHGVDEGRR